MPLEFSLDLLTANADTLKPSWVFTLLLEKTIDQSYLKVIKHQGETMTSTTDTNIAEGIEPAENTTSSSECINRAEECTNLAEPIAIIGMGKFRTSEL